MNFVKKTFVAAFVFAGGAVSGWLMAHLFGEPQVEKRQAIALLKGMENERDAEIKRLRSRVKELEAREQAYSKSDPPVSQAAVSKPKPKPDDLKRIEGVGPKISQVLQNAGIQTFSQLANTKTSRLEQILKEAGITLAYPETWPEQASLAAADDWDGLKALQKQLKGGRRV